MTGTDGSSRQGDLTARTDLEAIYAQMRDIAANHLLKDRRDHTLQATALVHEAWLRLAPNLSQNVSSSPTQLPDPHTDPRAFFALATVVMRRILIDHARARASKKRGGDGMIRPPRRLALDAVALVSSDDFETILAVAEAISRLCQQDAELAQIVELRFFAGLTEDQAADILGVSPRTLRRQWVIAKAWLRRELGDSDDE